MNNKKITYTFLILSLALSIWAVAWKQITSNFILIKGDGYDGVIENVIVTHWYWVLKGERVWNQVGYFYPHEDTLGYNDAYLIYGLIGAIYRIFTDNQFLAVELAHLSVIAIGFLSFYRLSRYLKITRVFSILGALVFTIFYSLTNTGHAQLLLVGLAPLLIYLILKALNSIDHSKFYKYAAISALLYGAMALTGFYIIYFATLFLTTALLLFICLNRALIPKLFQGQYAKKLIIWLAFFVACILPFLYVYIKKLKETGGHSFTEIQNYLPKIQDVINIGDGSLIWGDTLNVFLTNLGVSLGNGELKLGFGLFFFTFFIIASIYILFNNKINSNKAWVSIVIASIFWIICIIDFDGKSLWKYIYYYIPGGGGLRVISRIFIFLSIPTTLIIFKFLDTIWQLNNLIAKKISVCFVAILIVAEQINTAPFVGLNTSEQRTFLLSLAKPPEKCKSFYATNPSGFNFGSPDIDSYYQVNVRAMLVSSYFNLPTMIGVASFAPPGWNFAYEPPNTFEARALKYALEYNILSTLCVLNIKDKSWSTVTLQ